MKLENYEMKRYESAFLTAPEAAQLLHISTSHAYKGNPRVYKALRDTMREVLTELRRIEAGEKADQELIALIDTIAAIMGGLKEERK